MKDDGAWFLPKTFGYGAGLPIRWEGWVLLGVYVLVVTSAAFLIKRSPAAFWAILIVATAMTLPICAAKTRGGWHWR